MKQEKNRSIGLRLIIAGIVLFIFCVMIAFFWYKTFQRDKVAVASLTIALKDKGEGVNVDTLVPQSDSDAKNVPAYSFDIMNTGDVDGRYEVLLEDSIKKDSDGYNAKDLLTRNQLKYELILNGKTIASDMLSEIQHNVLDTRVIGANKTNVYQLRIWVPLDVDDWQNKNYHYKVVVNALNEGE